MGKILWQGRRSFRSQIGLICLFILGFFFNYQLKALLPLKVYQFFNFCLIIILLEIVRRVYDTKYQVTDEHIIEERGLLNILYQKNTINIEDIKDIKVWQTLLGRIFNFGTVTIGTAAESFEEIVFDGVKNPTKLSKFIKNLSLKTKTQSTE